MEMVAISVKFKAEYTSNDGKKINVLRSYLGLQYRKLKYGDERQETTAASDEFHLIAQKIAIGCSSVSNADR